MDGWMDGWERKDEEVSLVGLNPKMRVSAWERICYELVEILSHRFLFMPTSLIQDFHISPLTNFSVLLLLGKL